MLDVECATTVVLTAHLIVDIVDEEQRLASAALLALALRRSYTARTEASMSHLRDVVHKLLPTALSSSNTKTRFWRRALAADFLANVIAIYTGVSSAEMTEGVLTAFASAVPGLAVELSASRRWAKRGFGTGKNDQELVFDEAADYRNSVVALAGTLTQIASKRHGNSAPLLLQPLLGAADESGYKARDLAVLRSVLASATECASGPSPPVDAVAQLRALLVSREVRLQPPEKGEQKALFTQAAPSRALWLWDARIARYYVHGLCCALNADPNDAQSKERLSAVAASSTEEIILDTAIVVSATLDPRALWPELVTRLFERAVGSLNSTNSAVVVTALVALRKLTFAVTRLFAVAGHARSMFEAAQAMFSPTAVHWFRDLYAALRHILTAFMMENGILATALSAWVDSLICLHVMRCTHDDAIADAIAEMCEVTDRRACASMTLMMALRSIEAVSSIGTPSCRAALIGSFRNPMVELLASVARNREVAMGSTAGSSDAPATLATIVRRCFAVLDLPLAQTPSAECCTLKGLIAVASALDASDALLPRIAAECGNVASSWKAVTSGGATATPAAGDRPAFTEALRLQLVEAIAIAPTTTRRVALATTFSAL